MARYIHCENCKNKMQASAQSYGELYESVEGNALFDMNCDGACNKEIKKGDKCFAAVLLDNINHPNYNKQNPVNWATEYIEYK